MSGPVTLGAALGQGRENNLDLLRLAAASAVVVSHAWPLALGRGAVEPLEAALGLSLGGVAVLVFFFLSGMLISASAAADRQERGRFVLKRVLRIYPGLAVALIVTVLIAVDGGATAGFGELVIYVLRGLSLVSLQHEISGALVGTPYGSVVNGPLWTLFYEVLCYGIIATAIWSGLLDRVWGWVCLAGASLMLWAFPEVVAQQVAPALAYRLNTLAPLLMAFVSGAVFWRLRDWMVLDWRVGIALLACASLVAGQGSALPLMIVAMGYGLCLLAFRLPTVSPGMDLSYGIYIYGWPVAQFVVCYVGPATPEMLALLSLSAVLPVAFLSWHLVEKPALSLIKRGRFQAHRVVSP
ncbi:acyltransferase [Shimia sp. CNT1-13L.2]|uniref:acyltransferase family protein n=1 Tax=Shimia sp. CNT1-13L.2 TaxID=2959663 RepID=UPI0020CD0314|nr:acyltransferase [Shimia sp. CNT1-13L.2]MCP9481129.1 acyltransferase [Shimia sp. CNT1-13L.2]